MQILSGLFDHMVLQRNSRGRSDARITGTTQAIGPVLASVMKGNRAVPGFANKKIGKANEARFEATLAGLPAGGPYTVRLSAGAETLTVHDILVGDVWIAAGQSNMQGVGLLSQALEPHPMCRAFYMDDHWDVAAEPINETAIAIDACHIIRRTSPPGFRNTITGTGPALAFAQEMHRITGVPQGIIASAHGGTSMAEWDPSQKNDGGKTLYGATLRRFEKNGGKVAGMIWYQGESETARPEAAAIYPQKMQELIAAFRADLSIPNLPVAIVQLGRVVGHSQFCCWNMIQEMQRRLPESIKRLTTVPAVDLGLDDGIHIGGLAQHRLGKRLAGAMLALLKHPNAGPPPITIKKITVQRVPKRLLANVIIEFNNVVGELQAGARPTGFVMIDDTGLNYVFDVQLEKNKAILRTDAPLDKIPGKRLFYGYGCDPVCTIVDSADRSLPMFGPIPLPVSTQP